MLGKTVCFAQCAFFPPRLSLICIIKTESKICKHNRMTMI